MSPQQSPKQVKQPKASVQSSAVRDYWERLSWSDIADHFDDRTSERGRGYANNGHVESIWATDDGMNILAIVRGTENYRTFIMLSEQQSQFTLRSNCSCPVGSDCKHGVAAIAKYLDLLANNQSPARCVKNDDETWEVFSPNGTKSSFTIDKNEWSDEEEGDLSFPHNSVRSTKAIKASKDRLEKDLQKKLQTKSAKELADLVIQLFNEYDVIREHFEREAFAESVAATSDIAKLVEKAIKLIDKEFDNVSFDYDDRHHVKSSLNLDPVLVVVEQFARFDDPLSAIDGIARHLIEKATHYVEHAYVEDTYEIDYVFAKMADVLLQSKADPVKSILWSHEISRVSGYGFVEYAVRKIHEHHWPTEVWSGVADEMTGILNTDPDEYRNSWWISKITEALDKAKRQKEATDLLRKEASQVNGFGTLADRLIAFGLLDEAKKIALERRQVEATIQKEHRGYYHDPWPDRLKKIAELREDWPTLASIQATEFFTQPWSSKLKVFLITVKKIEGIEPAVRKSVQEFLQSGEYPTAIIKSFNNERPTPSDRKRWPIPFFSFQRETKSLGPLFAVLCEWAIDECRPDDVVKWFDEYQNAKTFQQCEVNQEKVADAIVESYPDKAFRIYRDLAEHEMEVTRQYATAVKILRKARNALELAGHSNAWPHFMEEIRTTHRRKTNLMKELDNLETPSIVQQKRKGR